MALKQSGLGSEDRGGLRPGVKLAVAVLVVVGLAAAAVRFGGGLSRSSGVPGSHAEVDKQAGLDPAIVMAPERAEQVSEEKDMAAPLQGLSRSSVPSSTTPVSAAFTGPVDPSASSALIAIAQLGGSNAVMSAESLALWRTNFHDLVQMGAAAVPAIRAFLDQKVDYPFSREAWQAVGYSSARLAAIDALRQIGGPEAIETMQNLLTTTQTPKEIAVLAWDLEQTAPGQYREEALATVRSRLNEAAARNDSGMDVAPLFEVYQRFGDASVIPELERSASQWKYYATVALANLPDNAGLPSLVRMADGSSSSGNRVLALEMLAQLSATNPDARQFLTAQVSAQKIPSNFWPYLVGPLSGDQYFPAESALTPYPELQKLSDLKTTHVAYGNQNFYVLPGSQSLTADGIQQRLAVVDELLKLSTDPTVVQALQRARTSLTQRSVTAQSQ